MHGFEQFLIDWAVKDRPEEPPLQIGSQLVFPRKMRCRWIGLFLAAIFLLPAFAIIRSAGNRALEVGYLAFWLPLAAMGLGGLVLTTGRVEIDSSRIRKIVCGFGRELQWNQIEEVARIDDFPAVRLRGNGKRLKIDKTYSTFAQLCLEIESRADQYRR